MTCSPPAIRNPRFTIRGPLSAIRHPPSPSAQKGMSLVAALFLIVVVALLGAIAVRIGSGQQQTVNLALLGNRALAAANAGIEVAAARTAVATPPGSGGESFSFTSGALNGFSVAVSWTRTDHVEGSGPPTHLYTVTSDASAGAYGTPEFVSRRVIARISR